MKFWNDFNYFSDNVISWTSFIIIKNGRKRKEFSDKLLNICWISSNGQIHRLSQIDFVSTFELFNEINSFHLADLTKRLKRNDFAEYFKVKSKNFLINVFNSNSLISWKCFANHYPISPKLESEHYFQTNLSNAFVESIQMFVRKSGMNI